MFFGPGLFLGGPGGAKNVEDLHVFFMDLAVIFFVDLDEFVLDLKEFFWTEMVFVFDTVFIFWTRAPALWTLLPYGMGGNYIVYMRSN